MDRFKSMLFRRSHTDSQVHFVSLEVPERWASSKELQGYHELERAARRMIPIEPLRMRGAVDGDLFAQPTDGRCRTLLAEEVS